jgi:anti-anti-sigma regulatory factor
MAVDNVSATEAAGAKLKITKVVEGDIMCLRLVGTIDEDFNGEEVAEQTKGTLILDLGEVRRISSFGIREWVDFIRAAEKKAHSIYFIECSPKILDQFNMVANFGGSGKILSFYAPYRCDYCDDDRRRLVQVDESYELIKNLNLPDVPCESCGNPEYFDEDPEAFFTHLQTQEKVEADAAVANFLADKLDYRVSDAARRLRVDKIVEKEGTFIRLAGDLDINFPREKLAEGLEGDVVVDLSAVGRVDDDGAREWMNFVRSVPAETAKLYLRDCQPGFVENAFTQEGLAGKVEVVSFFMPFKCPSCSTTAAQRVEVAEHYDVLKFATSPEFECSECQTMAPSIASEEFLACLGNLISPEARKELLEFAEEAYEKLLKPAGGAAAPVMTLPVAPAPAAGKTMGLAFIAAVLGALVVGGGLVGFYIYQRVQQDNKPKPVVFDEGGRFLSESPRGKPPWFKELQKKLVESQNKPALLDAAYVQRVGDRLFFIGYSYSMADKIQSDANARKAAFSMLVQYMATSVKDEHWRNTVVSQITAERSKILANLRAAIQKQDGLETRKWRRLIWNRHGAVEKALIKTAKEFTKPKEESYFQKVKIKDGVRWRFWIRLEVDQKMIASLVRQYTTPVEAQSQKVKVIDYFPGLAWKYPEQMQGAVVLEADKQAGPWKDTPLNVGTLVVTCAEIPIKDAAKFKEVVENRAEELKTKGGNVSCKTLSGADVKMLGYKVAKVVAPMRRVIHRGNGMRSGMATTMQFNVWDDPTK